MRTPSARRRTPRDRVFPGASAPRPTGRRLGALTALAAVATGLLVGYAAPSSAAPTPPPNPSDAQIGSAQAQKSALAGRVGALTAQLTQQKLRVEQLQGAAELAEQKYAYALQQLQQATAAAATAKQGVATAEAAVVAARTAFNDTVRANYTQGGIQGGPGALLAADDPDQVLQAATFQAYVTDHQTDGIGQLDRAKVAKANADAKARTAVTTQTALTAAAEQADQDARVAEASAESEQQALAGQQAATQKQLSTAYNALQVLLGQRQTYNDYVAEQARIAAQKAAEERARLIARQQAAARALAIQQAQQEAAANSGGGSSSGGGGSSSSGGGASVGSGDPSGGSWTAAKGQDAVNRAMQWLGTPYAWAGGTASGPTYGVCAAGAAYNDCHIRGFDCSGLVLYGWAPYQYMPHYTVAMWSQMAGNYHPSTSDLMPGDLLFYGYSAGSIHHVAMYIGNGDVIQAPQSGDHVRVTSLWNMGSDYYGAVRPLT